MAIELVKSGFRPSTAPPAVIFECTWELNGVLCYTCTLIDHEALHNPLFWDDMLKQITIWYSAKHRKNGECYELHGCKH